MLSKKSSQLRLPEFRPEEPSVELAPRAVGVAKAGEPMELISGWQLLD